jgi:hypothetical protein
MWITHLPQGGRIDEVEGAADEHGESLPGLAEDMVLKPSHVIIDSFTQHMLRSYCNQMTTFE